MLMRFDPFRDADPFRQFDRVVAANRRTPHAVPMDAVRRDTEVELRFDLPGVDPSSIDLEVERNVMTLRAERHDPVAEGEQRLVSERRFGRVARQVFLGDNLDGDRVEAAYHDGVLVVTVPVTAQAKAHKVLVAAGRGPVDTEAHESDDAPGPDAN